MMDTEYAVIAVPATPVRRKPGHRREMTNQLLFGERVKRLRSRDEQWVKVRSLHDGYEGWLTEAALEAVSPEEALAPQAFVTAALFNEVRLNGKKMIVPGGSTLPFFNEGKGMIGQFEYAYEGLFLERSGNGGSHADISRYALPWLEAPYLWGGRTVFGIDCSGFVQVVFKLMGFDLPRDAWQQAQEGEGVKKWRDLRPGDLAFFDDRDEIVHVGILLGPDRIIHASGKVRIDPIDKKGIRHAETDRRTHRLKAIRRIMPG